MHHPTDVCYGIYYFLPPVVSKIIIKLCFSLLPKWTFRFNFKMRPQLNWCNRTWTTNQGESRAGRESLVDCCFWPSKSSVVGPRDRKIINTLLCVYRWMALWSYNMNGLWIKKALQFSYENGSKNIWLF